MLGPVNRGAERELVVDHHGLALRPGNGNIALQFRNGVSEELSKAINRAGDTKRGRDGIAHQADVFKEQGRCIYQLAWFLIEKRISYREKLDANLVQVV